VVSGLALFVGLFNNLALLIVFVALYGYLYDRLKILGRKRRQLLLGFMFALFALGCMQVKIPVFEGVLVDQRNGIIILSGVFGGPLTAGITALVAASYRAYLGGQGVLGGTFGMLLSAIAGTAIHYRRRRIDALWKTALVAVGAAIFILPGFLPIGNLQAGLRLMKSMSLPYGAATSIGLFIGSLLLANEERRCETKTKLKESELKYRSLFESLIDVSYQIDLEGKITIISPSVEQMLGYKADELIGRPIIDFYLTPSLRGAFLAQLHQDGFVRNFQMPMIRKDGSIVTISTNARFISDSAGRHLGIEGVTRDITALKKAEEELKASLAEKETLLTELYHRTNNNMQLISSFLQLHASSIDDENADILVAGVGSRINAMSLVYEKLSRSKNLSRISAREYIADLFPLIERYSGSPPKKVAVELDIEEVALLIDTAIPLGLVINEIATNAFKHAFPADRKGIIRVAFAREGPDSIRLAVSDDGVGFPPAFDPYTTASFGIQTTINLVRMQMHGEIDIVSSGGVSYGIIFKDKLYVERI
jgi:PAS domain S-box-containing protein